MAQILDQYGQPIKRKELEDEQARPTLTGIRSIRTNNTSWGLDPWKLGAILREADDGEPEAYLELAEEIEEKESHYHSVLGARKRSVAQLDITVEAASDDKIDQENAEIIEQWLDRDTLEDEVVDILDAIGKGFSATEIMWDTSGKFWLPKELKWCDPRWFRFDREDGETLRMRDVGADVDLKPFKFIIHKHKAKSGLPIRGGVIRPVFWMFLFKNFSIKDWVTFAEAYGQPIRIGKYHAGASEDDRNTLLRAVANIGSDAAAIIPESMQIEFVESQNKSQTADVFERLCRFTDEQISKVVLGQTMTTDNGSSRSQAEVHNEVKHDIERSDAKQLAATLNKQLVQPIILLNKGPQERFPRIRIGRTENVDIEQVMNVADKGVRLGLKVSAKGLREKVGLPEPEDDDDILKVPSDAQQDEVVETKKETASAMKPHEHDDAIDDFAQSMAEDWQEIMNPIAKALELAAAQSNGYEEFQQKLLELASELEIDDMAESLAKANFQANIAGQVEANLKQED